MKKMVLMLALASAAVVADAAGASTGDVICLGDGVETPLLANGTCDTGSIRVDLRKWREATGNSKVSVRKEDGRVLVGHDTFQPDNTYLLIQDENSAGFVAFDSKSACAKYAASTTGQCLSPGQAKVARTELEKHK